MEPTCPSKASSVGNTCYFTEKLLDIPRAILNGTLTDPRTKI